MKITTKGQVTIPARIRDYLGVAPHAEVDFKISGDKVVLVKKQDSRTAKGRFSSMRGMLKTGPSTSEWMNATRGD